MSSDGIRVLKFGGSSVGDPAVMRRAAMVTTAALSRDGRPGSGPGVVVVSALGGVTRQLVQVADAALNGHPAEAWARANALRTHHADFLKALDLGPSETAVLQESMDARFDQLERVLRTAPVDGASTSPLPLGQRPWSSARAFEDAVLAFGELLASRLFWGVLDSLGVRCLWMDAREFLRTDANFGSASPDMDETRPLALNTLRPRLDAGYSVIVPGFIGSTEDGQPTTMGFEASDLTATVIGAALDAREVQIWTDVSGVMSADPRIVADVRPVAHLNYFNAGEMALLGARVLHPDTVYPARSAGVGVRVVNCSRPGEAGTLIDGDAPPDSTDVVVTARSGQSVVRVEVPAGTAADAIVALREACSSAGVTDALFATLPTGPGQTEVLVVGHATSDLESVRRAAEPWGPTSLETDRAAVSVVAAGVSPLPWPTANDAPFRWDGLQFSRGVLVPDAERDDAVRSLHAQCMSRVRARGSAGS